MSGRYAQLNEKPALYDRGVALVSVLWILAFLTVVAGGLSLQARMETRMTQNLVSVAQAREAAYGAVGLAVLELLRGRTDYRWRGDGSTDEIALGDAKIRVAVFDEAGRIDLNKASAQLLLKLFDAVGLNETDAAVLVDAVMDWRDPDQLHRLNGAEDDDYRRAGKPYGAKDGSFESVEELQLVLGMTPAIYTKIWPAVTVFSPTNKINASVASPLVRRAVDGDAADDRMVSTEPQPATDDELAVTQFRGNTYTVYARATVPDGASAQVGATVRLKRGSKKDPVAVLDWRVEPRAMDTVFGSEDGDAPLEQQGARS